MLVVSVSSIIQGRDKQFQTKVIPPALGYERRNCCLEVPLHAPYVNVDD